MKKIAGKFISMFVTLLLVSFFVFLAFELIPGDAATSMLGTQATPERIAALREELGLNRPFIVRYLSWLFSFIKGDMGISYSYNRPVSTMISGKLPITITLVLMAFIMIVAVSIPLGVFVSKHRGGKADTFFSAANQVFMAIPPFFSGIIITLVFGVTLKLFVPGGFVSYTKDISRFLGYMIFPAISVAIPKIAMTTKLLRTSILSEADKDYVKTAYSRGNSTGAVLYKHVLKNAIIPVITFLGMGLSDMVAGSIIIEQVFNIPGLSRILLSSIANRDYPVVMAVIMLIAFLVIVINFLVDVLYRIVDPRMK